MINRTRLAVLAVLAVLTQFALGTAVTAASFTTGNIVVYRVGDGSAALASSGTAIFLDEYATTPGTAVQSIALPTTTAGSNRRIVASGTASSEGLLTRSTDGRFIVLTGYDAALATASLTTSTSATVNRVIARVGANGVIDTTTALTDASTGASPRGVASTNGTDLWISGGAGAERYATLGGTTSVQLSTTPTNLRAVAIYGSPQQLFISSQSGATRVCTVGAGVPTTSGQTTTNLTGYSTTAAANAFVLFDLDATVAGLDTLYVAEETAGVIQKYSLVSGTWTANGTIAAASVRGLTGFAIGPSVTLFGTYSNGSKVFKLTDASGYNATITGTVTDLATAPTNTAFRGVALTPIANPPTVSSINRANASPTNAASANYTVTFSEAVTGVDSSDFSVVMTGVT